MKCLIVRNDSQFCDDEDEWKSSRVDVVLVVVAVQAKGASASQSSPLADPHDRMQSLASAEVSCLVVKSPEMLIDMALFTG